MRTVSPGFFERCNRGGLRRVLLAVDFEDYVARLNPGLIGRRAGDDLLHPDAAGAAVADLILEPGRQFGHLDAEEARVGSLVDARILQEAATTVRTVFEGIAKPIPCA